MITYVRVDHPYLRPPDVFGDLAELPPLITVSWFPDATVGVNHSKDVALDPPSLPCSSGWMERHNRDRPLGRSSVLGNMSDGNAGTDAIRTPVASPQDHDSDQLRAVSCCAQVAAASSHDRCASGRAPEGGLAGEVAGAWLEGGWPLPVRGAIEDGDAGAGSAC